MDDIGHPRDAPHYGAAPQYPIGSVDNALKVVLLLAQRPRLRTTEVSQYLGVASSSAHRLLAMLQYRGFVRQDPETRAFSAGPALNDLAFGVLGNLDIRSQARPIMNRLNDELQETIHLGRLEGGDIHFIAAVESPRALRVASRLGRIMPAHCTSTGKVLLATLDDAEVRRLYPEERLVQLTSSSIASRTRLLEVLADVRRRGFATSREESEDGVASVAVAVPRVLPRTALTASVPRSRLSGVVAREIRPKLTAGALQISELAAPGAAAPSAQVPDRRGG